MVKSEKPNERIDFEKEIFAFLFINFLYELALTQNQIAFPWKEKIISL